MTSDSRFFQLRAQGLARRDEDVFTQICFELGASGVAEDLKFVQKDLRYDPDVVETPTLDLNVFFTEAPAEGTPHILQTLQARFPEVRFDLTSEENKDWLAEWKKGFKPFPFAGSFWVIPSWLEAPPEAPVDRSLHILVEPGMAFGTGTHETTRLAAGFIIETLSGGSANKKGFQSLLDVGTGTGILALIAYRLGVSRLVGVDIDPEARRTARENLERNSATAIEIPDFNLEQVTGTFDVVVANIIDGVLLTLRQELVRCLRPGGLLIVSGILTDRQQDFFSEFLSDTPLVLKNKAVEGEWVAAVLERKA